jgi:hypothetical protein
LNPPLRLPTAPPLPRPSPLAHLSIRISLKLQLIPLLSVPTDLRPIVISGPSGVGKGTLYKLLLSRHPAIFSTSVSHTTRNPRPGEQCDVDYYYITMDEFEKMIEEKAFVEHAKFGGNRYGTSKRTISELTASGRVVVLDIEMEVCFLLISFLLHPCELLKMSAIVQIG